MEHSLFTAAAQGNTLSLLNLLRDDPLILEHVPSSASADTPLHVAAMLGHLGFVKELIKYKRNVEIYLQELNQHGFSAIHVASANGHVEVVAEFLKVSGELVNLKGRDELTPLHCACIKGRTAIVSRLLQVCNDFRAVISEVTVRGENGLHLAVKNNQFRAFEIMVEKIKQENLIQILNSQDVEGNTVLHLAAARKSRQATGLLLQCSISNPGMLQVNALNYNRLTALDLVMLVPSDFGYNDIETLLKDGGGKRARFLSNNQSSLSYEPPSHGQQQQQQQTLASSTRSSRRRSLSREEINNWEDYFKLDFEQSDPDKVRSDLLVVVVLMATATFQAVLSPPGGIRDDGDHKGEANLASNMFAFVLFVVFNSAGFFTSLNILMMLTTDYPMFYDLCVAIFAMIVTYSNAISSITPASTEMKIIILLMCFTMPWLTLSIQEGIRKWYKLKRRRSLAHRLDQNQS